MNQNRGKTYDQLALDMCDKVHEHVLKCDLCKRRLSFDPVEKALLKTHSMTNQVLELIAYMIASATVILCVKLITRRRQ